MTSDQVIEEVKKTNIRGRGGAGFQMGIKWESGRKSRGKQKYVICNGHEGEPNVFKDRRTFESDPHVVLEGIMIACYAAGASIGYAFIGGEFPLGIKRFKRAIKEAERSASSARTSSAPASTARCASASAAAPTSPARARR
jgi:NADH:ubiquinone oxidoreductase subunit F (NADH-binding)